MSVNRFAISSSMLCARPEALTSTEVAIDKTVIVDLGSSWMTDEALREAQAILKRRGAQKDTLLRIGRPDDAAGQDAVTRLSATGAQGFVLSGCRDVADIQMLDVMLRVAEVHNRLEAGSTAILAEIGDSSDFFLSPTPLRGGSQRLRSLLFDGEALTKATASEAVNTAAGRTAAPLLFARAIAVLKASQAGLPCYEMLEDSVSDEVLRLRQTVSLADGFTGVVMRSIDQLAALTA